MRESGIHTFSITAKSSYTEIQNIVGQFRCISEPDKYHLNVSHKIVEYKKMGVKILMNQSLTHPSWIRVIVNPSSLLAGRYCPIELFNESEKVPLVEEKLRQILDKCGITKRLREFKLSRFDATWNKYCIRENELENLLDLYRKSYVMPRYEVTESSRYEWTISCKSSEFSVYNKTYELKKRHNISIPDHVLRLELRLKSKRIRQITENSSWEGQLIELCGMVDKQLEKFLHRLYQDFGNVVTLDEVLVQIEHSSFRNKTKVKMKRLVELANKYGSLNKVREKMKLKKKKFKRLLDRFYKLGINPITQECEDEVQWIELERY